MCRMFVFEYIMKKFKWLKRIFGSQICVIRYLIFREKYVVSGDII